MADSDIRRPRGRFISIRCVNNSRSSPMITAFCANLHDPLRTSISPSPLFDLLGEILGPPRRDVKFQRGGHYYLDVSAIGRVDAPIRNFERFMRRRVGSSIDVGNPRPTGSVPSSPHVDIEEMLISIFCGSASSTGVGKSMACRSLQLKFDKVRLPGGRFFSRRGSWR